MGALLISDRRGVPWSDDARFFYFSLSYMLCMLWMWSRMGTHSYLKDQRGVPSSDDAHFFFCFSFNYLYRGVSISSCNQRWISTCLWDAVIAVQPFLHFCSYAAERQQPPRIWTSQSQSQDRIRSGPGRSGPRGSTHSWAGCVPVLDRFLSNRRRP